MNQLLESKIVVSPEKIRQTADQASAVCDRLISRIDRIDRAVNDSRSFCVSEGFEMLFDYYNDDKQNFDEIKKSLRRKIEMLNEIAALYSKAEKDTYDDASALPSSIIE